MSFSYSHQHMMPLMGNITNGANFMPTLGASPLQAIPGSSLIPHQIAGMNDSPLEFNMKKNQPPGAGPMDLEMANEHECDLLQTNKLIKNNNSSIMIDRNRNTAKMERFHRDPRSHEKMISKLELESPNIQLESPDNNPTPSPVGGLGTLTQNEMMFNSLIGMPQGFMMMPGMMNMIDPSSIISMQQFNPLLNQLNSLSKPPPPPSTTSNSSIVQNGQESPNSLIRMPIKEIINCKQCTLFPPNQNAAPPTTRERPPGCRTVFVGGLPENITEDVIREVFDRCGEITTLRLSKKNFCHIRFAFEASVDSAIYLSGYRIRINNNQTTAAEATNVGRLHVDYAQARDDQYEWECRQRQLQREARHRERVERDRLRPLSPPPIVHYTDHEASSVSEKLKMDESFGKAVQVLITWLERGDCNKKNSNTFYSMIQSTNSHVRRLLGEKGLFEEELARAKENYRKQVQIMMIQFTQIEKVFNAASHKKVWDHFTKAQRKNIDMWKKQSMEIRSVQFDDDHDEDEMEMSDDDKYVEKLSNKRAKLDNENLKEENDNLRCQLEAYKNEVDLVKSDLKSDTDIKDQQIKVLQETIRNLQTQLLENKTREKDNYNKIIELEGKLKAANVKELLLKTKIVTAKSLSSNHPPNSSSNKSSETEDNTDCINEEKPLLFSDESNNNNNSSSSSSIKQKCCNSCEPPPMMIDMEEAKIIGLVSTFLVVHPFGASTDYILSYIQRVVTPQLRPKSLEEILLRYPALFVEQVTGIGAKIERKWKFCGFHNTTSNNSTKSTE